MSTHLRLLLVTKSTGGVAEYIRWLVSGIDKDRFHLTVACLSEYGEEFAEELHRHNGVQAVHYAMNRYKIDPLFDLRVFFQLSKLIRSQRFDVIHAHASKPGYLARMAALGTGVPALYSPHCFAFHAGAGSFTRFATSTLEKLAARFTTRIVAVANGERELASSYRVGTPELFTVIRTGIDPVPYRQCVDIKKLKSQLGIPETSPVIGSVGRLNRQKSPMDFVRMAKAVHWSRPDAHFVWAGDGPLAEEVHALTASFDLEQVVHWLGERDDVPQLLHVMDCLVITSLWEGLPLVVLEAMASDVPVIATDIYGTRELVLHGESGFLAPAGDSHALARFALDLLADSEKRKRFASVGHGRIDNEFMRDRMISMLEDLYDEVASKGSVRNR